MKFNTFSILEIKSLYFCFFFCWWQIRKIAFPQWLIEFAKNLSILQRNVCQVRFVFQFCGYFDVLLDFLLQEFLWFRKQLFYSNFIASLQQTNLETVHNLVDGTISATKSKKKKKWRKSCFRNIAAIISYQHLIDCDIIDNKIRIIPGLHEIVYVYSYSQA